MTICVAVFSNFCKLAIIFYCITVIFLRHTKKIKLLYMTKGVSVFYAQKCVGGVTLVKR